MAIFIPGISCSICGNPVYENARTFLPFVYNQYDPLYIFYDAIVHNECFLKHPMASKCLEMYQELNDKMGPGKRSCNICSLKIASPEDYIGLACLSSDETNPLYRYNFTQYHKSCFEMSGVGQAIRSIISGLEESGHWKGRVLI
jgi:hypothetical protein